MIASLFHTAVYIPLYNALVILINTVPYADMGIAVILLTILVKMVLLPLSYKVAFIQQKMRTLAPKIEALKKEHKDDRQKQTLKTMELYKEHNVRPLLNILLLFVQLPVIIGLYIVFSRGGFPTVDTSLLYSFVHIPENINTHFLWVSDLSKKSIILAALAGVAQFVQGLYMMPKTKPRGENPTIQEDLAHSFQLQMKYLMPLFMGFIAYIISAAIALYLIIGALFTIGQEILVRHKQKQQSEEKDILTTAYESK